MNELENKIKEHIENWRKQCGYSIPFEYNGLNDIINKQLKLCDVGRSLPTEKEVTSEFTVKCKILQKDLNDENKDLNDENKDLINGYKFGFIDCYQWLKQR